MALRAAADRWLTDQAQQFALWLPVALGTGIAAWFALPSATAWIAAACLFGMMVVAGLALGGRGGRLTSWFGMVALLGLAIIWLRAERVAAPRIDKPVTGIVTGKVERVERLIGRGQTRVTLIDETTAPGVRVRINLSRDISGLESGARIMLRARLMPPAPAAIPGGYDFARLAWFKGIGATGRALGVPHILAVPVESSLWIGLDRIRGRLTSHVQQRLGGGAEGGIAASFVTGDQGGVPEDVAQALRDAGLTHLLSISGLHVAAVVGFAMVATRRLLALSVHAAVYWPLSLIGAATGAVVGIGYSLLAGGEVPTVRSCIAAILVLIGLAMGREAITLRIVAAGAFIILLFRPEALAGASFQLSFAAVTAIVALHESPWLRERLMRREEPWWAGFARTLAGLLLTGLVVEAALAPIGLYHFNRMGIYGAFANIIAIPLTTFIIMPLEAAALFFDAFGVGGPVWVLVKWPLTGLIMLADWTAALPGGVALAPAMPRGAFGLMIAGGLWLALWRGHSRLAGLPFLVTGAFWAWATPAANILITGDGRHAGIKSENGQVHLLRQRTGDYVAGLMSDATASTTIKGLQDSRFARCGPDACIADIWKDGRRLRLLATRSSVFIDRAYFQPACASADVVVSDRNLPWWCVPRWLKADRALLTRTGGLAIYAGTGQVESVAGESGRHPWSRWEGKAAQSSFRRPSE